MRRRGLLLTFLSLSFSEFRMGHRFSHRTSPEPCGPNLAVEATGREDWEKR